MLTGAENSGMGNEVVETGLNVEVVAIADPLKALEVFVTNGQFDARFNFLVLVSLLH